MTEEDVEACELLWREAFVHMRAGAGASPGVGVGKAEPERAALDRQRMRYLLGTDPDGSWVAEDPSGIVGLAQAIRREGLWVLSLFAVAVAVQGRGVGRRLLERVLGYGSPSEPGIIVASRDPRGIRCYVLAGFRLHPAVTGLGVVRRSGLEPVSGIREGASQDLDMAAVVDRRLRGASHGPDLAYLLGIGSRLLVVDGRGYTVVRDGSPVLLAALDDHCARQLLVGALAEAGPDTSVEVHWLTAGQQWAIDVCVAAGLELRPVGPLMLRHQPGPLAPYIPSGAFG